LEMRWLAPDIPRVTCQIFGRGSPGGAARVFLRIREGQRRRGGRLQ